MAGALYTVRIAAVESFTGLQYWECPAGRRWVVRNIDVSDSAGNGQPLFVSVARVTFQTAKSAGGAPVSFHWEGRAVVYAGEDVGLYSTGHWSVVITGYEFHDP